MYTLYMGYTIQCDVMRSVQFENGQFSWPTNYEPNVRTRSEQKINFATHENGRVGVFRIEIGSLDQKL